MKNIENNPSILIVDDEALIASHLRQMLIGQGYNAMVALDVASARLHLRRGVDLVLVDMNMEARTSGLELGQEISALFKVPFIFITANSEPALMIEALETQPASYLTKPFNPMDVVASVKLALQHRPIEGQCMVQVKDGGSMVRFRKGALKYALTDGNYLKLVTQDRHYFIRSTMDQLMASLDSCDFYRVHRTAIVNLHFVERHDHHKVILADIELPLAKNRKKGFKERMANLDRGKN